MGNHGIVNANYIGISWNEISADVPGGPSCFYELPS